jgi:hypothetical protein
VEKVRIELKWMNSTDEIELEGRYNVSFGMQNRWKTMKLNSEERWSAYKELVAESQDKALELFSTNNELIPSFRENWMAKGQRCASTSSIYLSDQTTTYLQ